ncbi:hypothetical protein D3Z58_24505, partial [Clostridiaceae bacterium]|nr:hypothetical protein [Clostridiaceae bacterium]
ISLFTGKEQNRANFVRNCANFVPDLLENKISYFYCILIYSSVRRKNLINVYGKEFIFFMKIYCIKNICVV